MMGVSPGNGCSLQLWTDVLTPDLFTFTAAETRSVLVSNPKHPSEHLFLLYMFCSHHFCFNVSRQFQPGHIRSSRIGAWTQTQRQEKDTAWRDVMDQGSANEHGRVKEEEGN